MINKVVIAGGIVVILILGIWIGAYLLMQNTTNRIQQIVYNEVNQPSTTNSNIVLPTAPTTSPTSVQFINLGDLSKGVGPVVVGSGHYLYFAYANSRNNSGSFIYDGKVVYTGFSVDLGGPGYTYAISENGRHYAFLAAGNNYGANERLYLDGKEIITPVNASIDNLFVTNSGQVFYNYYFNNQTLWEGDTMIVNGNTVLTHNAEDEMLIKADIICGGLQDGFASNISPNGQHFSCYGKDRLNQSKLNLDGEYVTNIPASINESGAIVQITDDGYLIMWSSTPNNFNSSTYSVINSSGLVNNYTISTDPDAPDLLISSDDSHVEYPVYTSNTSTSPASIMLDWHNIPIPKNEYLVSSSFTDNTLYIYFTSATYLPLASPSMRS
jgi:hypothetical protein